MNKFVIKHPLITEKATAESRLRKYIFLVDKSANSPEIKKAIHAIYRVDAVRVNLINVKPKAKRLGKRSGVKPGYKKAIVTLAEGQKLDVLPH